MQGTTGEKRSPLEKPKGKESRGERARLSWHNCIWQRQFQKRDCQFPDTEMVPNYSAF